MAEKPITGRQLDLLRTVAHYIRNKGQGEPPDVKWLAHTLHVSDQAVCNYKRELRSKGYLDPDAQDPLLTQKAWQLIERLQIVIPTQVPILGEVRAGDARGDLFENVVDVVNVAGIDYLPDTDFPTLTVPNTGGRSLTFALQVVGKSMGYENIFDGDYVIVQKFSEGEAPRQGELIVTYYLRSQDQDYIDLEQMSQWYIPEDNRAGPTLKYFYKMRDFYRLSWRKDVKKSIYTIDTGHIQPIGRVVGIYRDISG